MNPAPPKHFLRREFLMLKVLFETLFSALFLALYQPFSFSTTLWLGIQPDDVLADSLKFYGLCIIVLILSAEALYRRDERHPVSYRLLLAWQGSEVLLIAGIYLAFTITLGHAGDTVIQILIARAVGCVALIMLIPFVIAILYAEILDDREEIRLLTLNKPLGAGYLDDVLVNLYDHSGVLKISASQRDIYYIASEDNYVNIHYIIDEDMTSYLLRSSTGEIEAALRHTSIVRCHRSYLVNLSHVKVLKHGTGKATLVLSDKAGTEIPVSKSYYQDLLEKIGPGQDVKES